MDQNRRDVVKRRVVFDVKLKFRGNRDFMAGHNQVLNDGEFCEMSI